MSDDLSDVIADLATGSYAVSRPAVRTYDATSGELNPAGTATVVGPVLACVQPPTGRQLQRLEEGRRTHVVWSVWTTTPLLLQDTITIAGEDFEVEFLEDWTASGNFCKALAVKKEIP